ncbi:enterochelin esterase [Streptomyces sp. TP-A0874]|uniref:enterochelin esterase n=1 Tax=Streptomyces sp. TP-A0874 TaxID=549819 RepID=UPI00085347B7|nr:enterochelin esterase [Streptomyces sp. TP-A0874]
MPLPLAPTGTPERPPRIPRPAPLELARSPRVAALAAAPERVEEFWAEVTAEGTPLVEPDPAGDPAYAVVTFLWRGGAGTRAVLALPNKVADPRAPEANLLRPVPGTDVWHWSVRMRRDWRATYALCVDEGDGPDPAGPAADRAAYWQWLRGQARPDPLSARPEFPRRWGGAPLSVVTLPEAPEQSDWEPRPGVPRGAVSVHTVRSRTLGNERRVWVYSPAGQAAARGPGSPGAAGTGLPVLVLFDGEMWQPELSVSTLLDNLIADGRIPPLVALLPESVDNHTRWTELSCHAGFAVFLETELLPWAAERWPLSADPRRTVLGGQSLGGLTAAYTALRAPHRFGNVLAQSGSFWWPDGPEAQWLTGAVESRPAPAPEEAVRFWLSAGEQEWVLLPANRRLGEVLRRKGYEVSYREFNGGHDYLCWRSELADALPEALGG